MKDKKKMIIKHYELVWPKLTSPNMQELNGKWRVKIITNAT